MVYLATFSANDTLGKSGAKFVEGATHNGNIVLVLVRQGGRLYVRGALIMGKRAMTRLLAPFVFGILGGRLFDNETLSATLNSAGRRLFGYGCIMPICFILGSLGRPGAARSGFRWFFIGAGHDFLNE